MKDPIKMIVQSKMDGIPTFTIRATDKHAQAIFKKYASDVVNDENISSVFKVDVISQQEDFALFASENPEKIKSPD